MYIFIIILIYNITNRFISDNSLYNIMRNNYNMKINKNHIFSKTRTYFDAPDEINAYLKKIKPKRKEYFENGKFSLSMMISWYTEPNSTEHLSKVITEFLLTPYVFNELIYDKSKGNNFEVVDNYILKHIDNLKIDVNYTIKGLENEKFIYKYYFGVYKFNKNKFDFIETDKYERIYVLFYDDIENYFLKSKEPVDLEKLDVFEFMQNYHIYPIITFRYKYNAKKREKEVLEKINELFIKNMNLDYVGIFIK